MANRAHIPHSQRANRHQPRQGQQQQQGQHSFSPPTDSPSAVTYHHSSSTTSPQATSYDFPLPGPPHPLPHHAAGSSSSASQLSPTSLSSASSPYDTNPMIGSVPPQPSPYAPGYLTDLSHQNALANAAFDGLAQRQEYIHAASTATYPNLHGLDTRNLGGNIHPSALYSSFSFDSSGLPPYPLQQQNGYPPHGQGFPTGEQEMYFPPAPPQQNGFPQVDVDVGPSPPTHFPQQQQAYHPSLAPAQGYPSISPSSWGESEGYFSSSQQQFRPQPTAVQHAHAHGHGHGQQSGSSNELSSLGSGSADSLPQLLHGHAQAQGGNQFPHPAMNGNGNGNVSSSSGSGRNSNPNPKKRRLEDGRPHALPPPVRGDVKLEGEEEEEEEESDVDAPGGGGQQAQGKEQKKTAQACSHCKRLKMKCEREPGQAKCNRCLHRNQECEYLGRKPRVKSNWRDVLNKKLAEKDATIQYLLKQLNNPWPTVPFHASSSIALGGAGPGPNGVVVPTQRSPSDIQAWAAEATAATSANGSGGQDHLSPTSQRSGAQSMRAQLLSEGEQDSDEEDEGTDNDGNGPAGKRAARGRSPAELLPLHTTPFGLLADSRVRTGDTRSTGKSAPSDVGDPPEEDEAVGFANEKFFAPGPTVNAGMRRRIIEWQTPPEITERGIVSPDEVRKLFNIFYDRLNPVLAIFDPAIHTPAHVYGRCPFLFTVVCAISSRYYRERPELYQIAMHLARTSAATSLINGWKSLEICQAYIMMSVYSLPAKRWEEDRSWLYLGLAIRMATDLNLHVPITTKGADEVTEREILNRYRTWEICFNLDRSAATQLGRPTAIREDYIIRHSASFYKRSKYNHPYDIHLCAYTNLLRIMARFLEAVYSDPNAPTGLNKNIDWLGVTTKFEQELQKYRKDTEARFAVESNKRDPACRYRVELLPFLFQYSRLVLWSFGFQQAFEKKLDANALSDFFNNAYGAATEVVRIVVTRLAKTEYFSFAPDGHFLFVAFASAFLLKLLRPEFLPLLADTQQAHIVSMITSVVEVFNSVAIDNMHTPRLYARFLQTLLEKRHTLQEEGAAEPPSATETEPQVNGIIPTEIAVPAAEGAPTITVTEDVQALAEAPQMGETSALHPVAPIVYVEGSVSGAVSTVGDGTETEVPASTFGGSLFNLDDMENDADYLASMRALNNSNWSSNMLLPGWSWPADDPMDWFVQEEQPVLEGANYMDQLNTFTDLNTM